MHLGVQCEAVDPRQPSDMSQLGNKRAQCCTILVTATNIAHSSWRWLCMDKMCTGAE